MNKMQENAAHCYYVCLWMVNIEVTAIDILLETATDGKNIENKKRRKIYLCESTDIDPKSHTYLWNQTYAEVKMSTL